MPWRPALARPVPAGEEVPAADPRTVTSQTPAVNIVPTASNSGYEATCASYPATMTMKEGWVAPSVPLSRLNADGTVPQDQDGAHLCNEVGPRHGRKCVHCGNNKTTFIKMRHVLQSENPRVRRGGTSRATQARSAPSATT